MSIYPPRYPTDLFCDEIGDPSLKRLQNVVATKVVVSGITSTYRQARNAKAQFILEAVNDVLPAFADSAFTVPEDRKIVRDLLIAKLKQSLPPKQGYIANVSDWKTSNWTTEELSESFKGKLEWEALSYDSTTPVFEPKVPQSIEEAVADDYKIDAQPETFGLEKNSSFMHGWERIAVAAGLGALAVLALFLWAFFKLVRWVFGF